MLHHVTRLSEPSITRITPVSISAGTSLVPVRSRPRLRSLFAAGLSVLTQCERDDGAVLCGSNQEEPDTDYEPVHYRRVFLDDEDMEVESADKDGGGGEGSLTQHDGDDGHGSDQSYGYSDDHESYSDGSECDAAAQQETGE